MVSLFQAVCANQGKTCVSSNPSTAVGANILLNQEFIYQGKKKPWLSVWVVFPLHLRVLKTEYSD